MLEKITINNTEYYQHNINGNVGDIFQDPNEIESKREKLINQINKTKLYERRRNEKN